MLSKYTSVIYAENNSKQVFSEEFEEVSDQFIELLDFNKKLLQAFSEEISELPNNITFCKQCINSEIKQMQKELEYLQKYGKNNSATVINNDYPLVINSG